LTKVFVVFAATLATFSVAFRPAFADSGMFYVLFGVPHLALAAFAARYLAQQGKLWARITPTYGDISIGALSGLALLVASWGARAILAPSGSPRQSWLLHLYLQFGDPERLQHSVLLTGALCVIVLCEELVWRGFVLEELTERLGTRRGWLVAALLYAVAALPTVYLQRDAVAGPNPLLVVAAFGCGIVWTFMAGRFGRLLPGAFSHLVFTYFSAVQFRWPV
jgi:membrane protease YdiL (CAAX protease family)